VPVNADLEPGPECRGTDAATAQSLCRLPAGSFDTGGDFGHWLTTTAYYVDGALTAGHLFRTLPWTQWLTWVFHFEIHPAKENISFFKFKLFSLNVYNRSTRKLRLEPSVSALGFRIAYSAIKQFVKSGLEY
jgi:hypothetical protein